MKRLLNITLICALAAGCAEAPDRIQARYVSPLQYTRLDCDQLRDEMRGVSAGVASLVDQQQSKHDRDEIAMGVGLFISWPALLLIVGGDKRARLAEMKGRYDAVESEGLFKNCPFAIEVKRAADAAAR